MWYYWYIVRLDSSRVATPVKLKSGTQVSSSDPTRVKSNYIPVYTTILWQIETLPCRCCNIEFGGYWVDDDDDEDEVGLKEKPEDTRYIKKITSK